MARQVAIAIGVSSVPGLPVLAGVPEGVDEFASWAISQGFEVLRHVDSTAPVHADDLFRSVKAAVDAGDVERLYIYFSGHGLSTGVAEDLWLCSDANTNPADAVNVAKSARIARYCGIPHVVVFADACRNPRTGAFQDVIGQSIFPSGVVPNTVTERDEYYATGPGVAAYEQVGEQAFGVFSRCLMEALQGRCPEILDPVQGGRRPRALLSRKLAQHLYSRVPQVTYELFRVTQRPDCVPGSAWQPNALAWFDDSAVTGGAPGPTSHLTVPPGVISDEDTDDRTSARQVDQADASFDSEESTAPAPPIPPFSTPSSYEESWDEDEDESVEERPAYLPAQDIPSIDWIENADVKEPVAPSRESLQETSSGEPSADDNLPPWAPPRTPQLRRDIDSRAIELAAQPGRAHFETRVGASLVCTDAIDLHVPSHNLGVFVEDHQWQVRGYPEHPETLLAQVLPRDSTQAPFWVASALFPGYVTTLTVGPSGTDHVATLAIDGHMDADRATLAHAAAAYLAGDRLFPADSDARELIERGNPVMCTLAAYVYDRVNQPSQVERMLDRVLAAGNPVPFDVALLADALDDLTDRVVPGFPLMTRGWDLLDILPVTGDDGLAYGLTRLTRSPWTSFTHLDKTAVTTLLQPGKEMPT